VDGARIRSVGGANTTMSTNTHTRFEADLISARRRAGLEGARLKGNYAGNPSFGRVPDDVRARIRHLRQSGLGLERIAATLTAEEVPTVRGGRWTKGTIARIVSTSN
jgi:DNA invertase Pin-like site-specific DNA recombinase